MNTRIRKCFLALGFLVVVCGVIFLIGTNLQIRYETGIWLSPLAIAYGGGPGTGDESTNVAVSFPSASEQSRLKEWFKWRGDDKVVFNHNIPWYEDLVDSTVLMSVTDLARNRMESREWQVVRFSKSGYDYDLFYNEGKNLLWIVQNRLNK